MRINAIEVIEAHNVRCTNYYAIVSAGHVARVLDQMKINNNAH